MSSMRCKMRVAVVAAAMLASAVDAAEFNLTTASIAAKEAWDFKPVDQAVIETAKGAIKVFCDNVVKVFDPVALSIDLPNYLQANSMPSRYERVHAINQE